jgi:hypothetical protein
VATAAAAAAATPSLPAAAVGRVRHRYGKTCGFSKMGSAGTGTVVDFGTPWHTVYPYRGIAGMLRVNYSLIYLVLKLFFVVVFVAKFIVSQCDVTKYGYAICVFICASYRLSLPLPPHFKTL